jgi:hypothetical protein
MKASTTILLLILSLLLFNCEEEEPITDEELAIDSCTLEPNYVSIEGWQEVSIDNTSQTTLLLPVGYVTFFGYGVDTWVFEAKGNSMKVSFSFEERGPTTSAPIILKEPLASSWENYNELLLIKSQKDSTEIIGAVYFSCAKPESSYGRKWGTFFIMDNEEYTEVLWFHSSFDDWDEAYTILSTATRN